MTDLTKIPGYGAAITAVQQYKSARMRYLEILDNYVKGTQYAGRPDWFSSEVPLWERAPCVVYPIARTAIDSNVDLLLGEATFPAICVPHVDDKLESDGPKKEDAELVNRWLVEFEHYARLRPVSKDLFFSAQSCGSACAIVAIRDGLPVVDTTRAAWCTPTLDVSGRVTELVIQYPYLAQIQLDDGTWKVEAMLYRRKIDATADITYRPARIDSGIPKWVESQKIEHGLGFCPVIWYAHQKGCSTIAEVDGHAIHEYLLDEITALDFTLSQRHRAAMYAGDPQWTEVGVEPGENPSGGGRMANSVPATMRGGAPGANNPIVGHYSGGSSGTVRKKSPGDVWQYESPDAKVTLHTLPGDALKSIDDHAKDLKTKICEALGVVFLDPQDMPRGGELSGRAIAALKARQLDRCDSSRSDFGDLCLRPLVTMLLRIVTARPTGLRLPGLPKVAPLLAQLLERGLLLRLDWGPYSRPEPAEELALVQAATLALEKGIATIKSAVMMTKDVLGVEDVDEHVAQLEVEKVQRQKEAMETMQAAALAPKPAPAAGKKPKKSNGAAAQTKAV